MVQRPPEYVHRAIEAHKRLTTILRDKILFCLVDPQKLINDVFDILEDLVNAVKLIETDSSLVNIELQHLGSNSPQSLVKNDEDVKKLEDTIKSLKQFT